MVFINSSPSACASVVDAEVHALVHCGCVAWWADFRGPGGAPQPRLVMALSGKEAKTALCVLREAVKQEVQANPVLDGYGVAGG